MGVGERGWIGGVLRAQASDHRARGKKQTLSHSFERGQTDNRGLRMQVFQQLADVGRDVGRAARLKGGFTARQCGVRRAFVEIDIDHLASGGRNDQNIAPTFEFHWAVEPG